MKLMREDPEDRLRVQNWEQTHQKTTDDEFERIGEEQEERLAHPVGAEGANRQAPDIVGDSPPTQGGQGEAPSGVTSRARARGPGRPRKRDREDTDEAEDQIRDIEK